MNRPTNNHSLRWIGVLLGALAAAGCPDKDRAVRPKNQLVVHAEAEPSHLVSIVQPDGWAHRIATGNILEGLTRINPRTYAIEGALASTWQVSEDHLTYTFYLRAGVRWHDGEPFSGKDVRFTFDRVLDPKGRAVSARATLAPFIESYKLVEPDKFRVVCKKPSAHFLVAISDLTILPAHLMRQGALAEHPLLRKPVGTGPYRFVGWQNGRQITLQRFDKYWGKKPRIEKVVYRFVSSPEMALQLARKGQLDFISRVRAAQWVGPVKKDPVFQHRFVTTRHYPPGTSYIMLNHKNPIFSDVRVRRALGMLLDRQTIATKIYHGLAHPVAALYWVKEPDYNQQVEPLPFDPEKARQLLAAAGFADQDENGVLDKDGEPFRFTFAQIAGSQTSQLWATMWQEELRKAGIVMEISPIDWATYLGRIRKHDFDAGTLFMTIVGPFTDLYLQFHSSQIDDGQNYAAYRNPRVDRLLESIRSEMDAQRRREMSLQVQQILADQVAVIPLFALEDPGLVHRRVHGVYTSALWYQVRDWWIE